MNLKAFWQYCVKYCIKSAYKPSGLPGWCLHVWPGSLAWSDYEYYFLLSPGRGASPLQGTLHLALHFLVPICTPDWSYMYIWPTCPSLQKKNYSKTYMYSPSWFWSVTGTDQVTRFLAALPSCSTSLRTWSWLFVRWTFFCWCCWHIDKRVLIKIQVKLCIQWSPLWSPTGQENLAILPVMGWPY